MCCVQRRRLLSPYCISQFSLLLIHTHLVSWDMRRQACWVTDASQKRVWGPEAHSVIWSNTHVMMRHCEPHGRRQRRRIIWERAFCVCEPVGTSACYTLHSWPYVFTVREKADIWRPLLHSGPLAYLTHGLYRGETQTQPEITSVSQQASPEIHFLTKLCLVSIQEQLNVHCLIREKYSLAGRASSHCDWSLVLKKRWQRCFTVSTTLCLSAAGLWLRSKQFTTASHPLQTQIQHLYHSCCHFPKRPPRCSMLMVMTGQLD